MQRAGFLEEGVTARGGGLRDRKVYDASNNHSLDHNVWFDICMVCVWVDGWVIQ